MKATNTDFKLLRTFNKVENTHWWWAGRRQLLNLLLKGHRPKKVLDVGFGTGQTMRYVKKLYPKAAVFGVDLSPLAIKYALKNGLKHVQIAKAENLPYKDNTFDTVLLLDVIEHIKNDSVAIKEAKRVTKPGGCIVVTTPALSFIWSDHDRNQGHYRRYTRSRLRMLAHKNNLDQPFISYFNFLLSPIVIVIRILGNLKLFGQSNNYDSKVNYSVAKNSFLNGVLKKLFISEVSLLRHINYPIGISIATLMIKNDSK